MLWQLKRGDLKSFTSRLRRSHDVIAPVLRDILRYDFMRDGDSVVFEQPLYSAKQFVLPLSEPLLRFKDGKPAEEKPGIRKRAIFLSKCDANALFVLDKLMLDAPQDPYYRERRRNMLIFQFEPLPAPPNYFGDEMDLIDFCDVKVYNKSQMLILKPESHFGMKLLKGIGLERHYGKPKNEETVHLPKKEVSGDKKKVWAREAKNCLSCSACTTVCPTCSCFELYDDISLDCSCGKRCRDWSSCQQLDFTEVAGGHVFRRERALRVKQRVLHKFKYFRERFGVQMCVGCGRCISSCPTGINIREIAEELR